MFSQNPQYWHRHFPPAVVLFVMLFEQHVFDEVAVGVSTGGHVAIKSMFDCREFTHDIQDMKKSLEMMTPLPKAL